MHIPHSIDIYNIAYTAQYTFYIYNTSLTRGVRVHYLHVLPQPVQHIHYISSPHPRLEYVELVDLTSTSIF